MYSICFYADLRNVWCCKKIYFIVNVDMNLDSVEFHESIVNKIKLLMRPVIEENPFCFGTCKYQCSLIDGRIVKDNFLAVKNILSHTYI